jgi:hypothetical protein
MSNATSPLSPRRVLLQVGIGCLAVPLFLILFAIAVRLYVSVGGLGHVPVRSVSIQNQDDGTVARISSDKGQLTITVFDGGEKRYRFVDGAFVLDKP